MRTTIAYIDTETTGLDPNKGAEVFEFAGAYLNPETFEIEDTFETYLEIKGDIPPDVSGVTHVIKSDIPKNAPGIAVIGQYLGGCDYVIAHNAPFDAQFVRMWMKQGAKIICTYKLAQHLYPDAPNWKLGTLRYMLGMLTIGEYSREYLSNAHKALPDVIVGCGLAKVQFERLGCDIERMVKGTNAPVKLKKIGFGKHRGSLFDDLPSDYLDWIVNKSDIDDEDVIHTAKLMLARRLQKGVAA